MNGVRRLLTLGMMVVCIWSAFHYTRECHLAADVTPVAALPSPSSTYNRRIASRFKAVRRVRSTKPAACMDYGFKFRACVCRVTGSEESDCLQR